MSAQATSDFVINIATVNGSGSQTANTVLLRSLFRQGVPVGGKNVFPSNIQGMPTWFWIRADEKGFVGAKANADIVLAFNSQTFEEDQKCLSSGGFFFYPQEKMTGKSFRKDIVPVPIPFQKLSDQISASIKIKKLAANMVYVGILSRLLHLNSETVKQVIKDQIGDKITALNPNLQAFDLGFQFALEELSNFSWPYQVADLGPPLDQILMDGNTAAGLGLVAGGCQMISWYPITPSTSVVESFSRFAGKLRLDPGKRKKYALVQAEDELSAFSMVLGAGWAGTRALTATSGPGLSLMAEAAGYAYYAEIPSVIWDVQRLGPSTGLPTRTAQGDLLCAATLSHGDTKHVLLLPGSIRECFEFGQICFDLAERLQQLVIVLSDLDLGMNLWRSEVLKPLTKAYDRGQVWTEQELESNSSFSRYDDGGTGGIAPRTLPGNTHTKAAYFTRGSGHNAKAQYSEKPTDYRSNMDRLARKWETAQTLVPKPEIQMNQTDQGLIYYGSTNAVIEELCFQMKDTWNLCRLKAYPFSKEVEEFLRINVKIYIIEQNRDGQMKSLLVQAFPQWAGKMESILHYDGSFVTANVIQEQISARRKSHE